MISLAKYKKLSAIEREYYKLWEIDHPFPSAMPTFLFLGFVTICFLALGFLFMKFTEAYPSTYDSITKLIIGSWRLWDILIIVFIIAYVLEVIWFVIWQFRVHKELFKAKRK